MSLFTIVILGIGLSMDAFAVSICKGLALSKITWKDMMKAGLWFGLFQGLMPLIGFFFGSLFTGWIEGFASWIAFILLGLIGSNMAYEGWKNEDESISASMSASSMFILAIATSIDALAVGITFSVVPVAMFPSLSRLANTILACVIITLETGILSAIGIKIGEIFGSRFKNKAQIAGGIVLIAIGLRILISHYM